MIQSTCLRAVALKVRRALFPLLLSSAFVTGGCNERPTDLREWRVSDHDQSDAPPAQQGQVDPSAAGSAMPGLEDVTIVAWSQNCTQCHGQLGRGDGPRGPMLRATNLSDPAWQDSVTDEQIAAAIKLGRGAMPSFKQLPDVTIANLVKLVRMMSLARLQAHAAAAPSGSVAPGGSASGAPRAAPSASSAAKAPAAPKTAPAPATTPPL
ncbi:MAG: cytochrome c [Myxococcales bacterium]|nr:MAG: cytochrome c [Myxococcales bacterium]